MANDDNVISVDLNSPTIQPSGTGVPLVMDDVFPELDVRGMEDELNEWFENDIMRCIQFVDKHKGAWARWNDLYDLMLSSDVYADIGGRSDYPSGLLCEKTIEATDRLMRAVYAPDPIFAVHESMTGEEDMETILRLEKWFNYYCRNKLDIEKSLGKRAFLDFILYGSCVVEPDLMFKVVPQRTVKTYRTSEELQEDEHLVTDVESLNEKYDQLDRGIPVRVVVEREDVEEMGLNLFIVDLEDHLIPPNVYADDEIRFRGNRLYYTESDLNVLCSDSVGFYRKSDVDKVFGARVADMQRIRDGHHPQRYSHMRSDAGVAPGYEWYDAQSYGDKAKLPYENVFIVMRIYAKYAYPTKRDPRGVIPKWTVFEWEPASKTILRSRTYPHFDERLPWVHFRMGYSPKSYYGFGFGALLEQEDSRQTSIMNLYLDAESNAAFPPYLVRSPESDGDTPFRMGMGPGQVGYVQNPTMDFKQVDLRGPGQGLLGQMLPISNTLASNRTGITSYTQGQSESTDPRSPARKTEMLLGQAQLSLESIIRDWNLGFEELAQHVWASVYENTIIRGEDRDSRIVPSAGKEEEVVDSPMATVTLDDLERPVRWTSQASAGVVNPQARKSDFINKFSFFMPLIQQMWQIDPEVGARYFIRWLTVAAVELELRGKKYLIPTEEEVLRMQPEAMQKTMEGMQTYATSGGAEGETPIPSGPEPIDFEKEEAEQGGPSPE